MVHAVGSSRHISLFFFHVMSVRKPAAPTRPGGGCRRSVKMAFTAARPLRSAAG